jgi:hypothetical protein
MKKYRKIRKTDKLPELPKGVIPIYILIEKNYTYIFGSSTEKNYTFTWDKVSKFPNEIQSIPLTPTTTK